MLFDLFNPLKNRYPAAQGNKDQERVQQIRQKYSKLKNVKDFEKEIYVPSFMQKQYCLFYGRFESGNLNRVVQRNMGSSSMEYDALPLPLDPVPGFLGPLGPLPFPLAGLRFPEFE